jgi:polysaccharide biosynthesis protein PslJ
VAVGALIGVVVVAAGVLVASPLATLVQQRLDSPHSNGARIFTTERTLDAVSYSPVLGLGTTREPEGGGASIAAGASPDCPRCGSPPLGTNGQLWGVLLAHGIVGALLFVGFFVRSLWTYRHDRSPIGDAGLLAVVLSLFFMLVYQAVAIPLMITFLSIGLLWRNRQAQTTGADDGPAPVTARSFDRWR